MPMSNLYEGVLAALRAAVRIGALAGLLAAGLLLGPTRARAAENAAPQPGTPAHRVSPYARYARDHAKSVEKKPARVKPVTLSGGHGRRVGARGRR
jgi:hypothetical protein